MEFDTKYREDISFKPTFLQENYLKPEFDDGFSSIEACTSKGIFQDFQKFDQQHQFPPIDGFLSSSSNPRFGIPGTAYVDPFEAFLSGNDPSNFDVFESKPLIEEGGNGLMEKFHNSSTISTNTRGGGFLNFPLQGGGGGGGGEMMMMMIEQEQDGHLHQQMNHLMPAGSSTLGNFREFETHVNLGIPDEYSCVTGDNGIYGEVGLNNINNNNKRNMPAKRNGKAKKSNVVKGQWTMEEDRLLIHLVEQFGVRKWSHIAQMLNGRIGKQCRERWHNHLRPNIKKDTWSEEEDKVLIRSHIEIGNKWAEIAKRLPGRTENSIKNHWNATKRRQFSRRRCRSSKYPKSSSLLQNYIKGLGNSNSSSSRVITSVNNTSATASVHHPPKINSNNVVIPPATSTNMSNVASNTTIISRAPLPIQQEKSEFYELQANDSLGYDFNEVPDFCFDNKMFSTATDIQRCSIESLFDIDHHQMLPPCSSSAAMDERSCLDLEMMPMDMMMSSVLMQCEVKKEMDLMEMITQTNM